MRSRPPTVPMTVEIVESPPRMTVEIKRSEEGGRIPGSRPGDAASPPSSHRSSFMITDILSLTRRERVHERLAGAASPDSEAGVSECPAELSVSSDCPTDLTVKRVDVEQEAEEESDGNVTDDTDNLKTDTGELSSRSDDTLAACQMRLPIACFSVWCSV